MKIAAIIVAAGRSSRFSDGNKLIATFNGRPLVSYAVTAAASSRVDDVVLVIAPDGSAIADAAGQGRWRIAVNARATEGLSASIQTGLAVLANDIDGAMIMLADMPGVTSAMIDALCAAFTNCDGRAIVVPQTIGGQQGNPVLWPRVLFPDLMALTGDAGGKSVLNAHHALQLPVPIASDAITFDIDTAADLAGMSTVHARRIIDY